MALNIYAKVEGRLICTFKNDMRNFGNFHQGTWMYQNLDFNRILLSKVRKCMNLKFYRGFICHGNEKRCKTGRGIDLPFENWHEDFVEFWPKHSKFLKICFLMGCL